MATIYIENKPYEAKAGASLLETCLSLGFNVPYFCWHPVFRSVGACRQCAVKVFRDDKDSRGRIVMSCMEPVADGMRVSIDDPDAKAFRARVIEWLMTNHPHDCPVCDEGGECHLQDMTQMSGHVYRRFRFKKRTHRNQDLGPFINHEMNRCIQCYRCVRFYRDYALGRDLDVFASHNSLYFGRQEDGKLESEFSGNLVEVCPTGVFTDRTLKRHYARKWDLQTAPSVCVHCGLGCNTIAGERYGTLRRILNRYHGDVNGYFLCDRGRFGYEFVNGEKRLRGASMKNSATGAREAAPAGECLARVKELLVAPGVAIGIGSPRASLESNFALRELVGADNFYAGIGAREFGLLRLSIDLLRGGPARIPTLAEAGRADAVLVLGEDAGNTAPMLALALRQALFVRPRREAMKHGIPEWDANALRNVVQFDRGPLFTLTPGPTRLDPVSTRAFRASPDDIARIGFAVAHMLDNGIPLVEGLVGEERALAASIVEALSNSDNPLVVSGPGCGSDAVIRSAAAVAGALCRSGKNAGLFLTSPECNSTGLALMADKDLDGALHRAAGEGVNAIIILENNLYLRAEKNSVDALFASGARTVALDSIDSETARHADIILPTASFAGSTGTLVSSEGRAQRHYRVFIEKGESRQSWEWLDEMLKSPRRDYNGIVNALADALPVFAPVRDLAPDSEFRITGLKVPRQTHRRSGRTAEFAHLAVSETKPPADPDTPFTFTMEGTRRIPPAPLINLFWRPSWNSAQSVNKFQDEVGGPLRGGNPGRRLLEPGGGEAEFGTIPAPPKRRDGEWTLVPAHEIFGSEELSALSPAIAGLDPGPRLIMRPEDAASLGIGEGDPAEIRLTSHPIILPVKLDVGVPAGTALVYLDVAGERFLDLPRSCAITGVKK